MHANGDRNSVDPCWYRDGLRFECTRCGDCCRGAPGFVWVDSPMIQALADYLRMPPAEFTRQYVRKFGLRLSLIEKPNYDCVFWETGVGCTVYPVRPVQCRTFPFWPENIERPEDWASAQRRCPGVGRGQLYPADRIREIACRAGPT